MLRAAQPSRVSRVGRCRPRRSECTKGNLESGLEFMKTMCSALTAIALTLLLEGCLGGGGNETFADGFYRFVHVSPGTDNVTISADGNSIVSSLQYHAATSYIQLSWGTHAIKVQSVTSGATYADSMVPVAGVAHYTYFLYGGGSSTTAFSLRDDITDPAAGYFLLRDINLATGSGPLDMYLLAPGVTVDASTPAFSAIAYATSGVFTQVPNGNYNIVVTPAGSKEIIYESGNQAFSGSLKVSVATFATGSGKLVNAALLIDDAGGTTIFADNSAARFKFLGATADVQSVDLLIDGAVALANVPYGSVSAYGPVAAGSRNFKIQPSNTPGAYIYDQSQTLKSGVDHSLAAYSIQGTGSAGLLVLQDNNLPPPAGKATLRIGNAASDGTTYDAYVNSTKVVAGLAPATAAPYQTLDAATYTVSFNPAGTTTVAATLSAVLAAGHVYTVYTYGRSGSAAAVLTTDN